MILTALMTCVLALGTPPNVVVILTDDQGSIDAGCYGSDAVTPAIDGLADTGTRFTRFYAAAPVCSPSRAALLTGRYPLRAGLTSNAGSSRGNVGMPSGQVTIAEVFRAQGYATAHVGKWHLGWTDETDPLGQGFDHSFGHMGGCIDNWSHFFYWNGPNRHDLWRDRTEVFESGRYFMDLCVEECASFIARHEQDPFLLYLALNAPHYPYQGEMLSPGPHTPRELYTAFVRSMDARIGAVLDLLEARGLRERTIVVFQSDHGHSVEVRAHGGGGDNGPYRGHKFTVFEGGIRVPAIISWPGSLPEGVVRDQTAHACDWLPTLAALCGIELDREIDGLDLGEVIRADAPSPHDVLHWHVGPIGNPQWAVMDGPWKLMGNAGAPVDGPPVSAEDRALFLSNVIEEPGEERNLAEAHPEIVERLQSARDAWLQKQ